MANGASRIFKVMQNSGTDTVSELVHLKVKTINPLTFTLDDRVTLTEDFVELNSNINKSNLKIDDILTAFSLNGGQLFFIQQYFSENPISRELPAGGNQGQILSKKSNEDYDAQWIDNNGGITGDTLPIGAVVEFPSDNIPDNWLLCNGQAVSRTDYAELFAAIGTTWGAGDGSTTFNVPTKEGLVTIGKKTSDSDFNTIGKTGGEKTHTLTVDEMPSHNHNVKYNTESGIASASVLGTDRTASNTEGSSGGGDWYVWTTGAGGDRAHNNLQPYTTSNFIIKAKQSAGVVATVVDNLNSTSTIDALSAKQGKELNEKISGIIESGSNSNGSYIKFSDGTMICRKYINFGEMEVSNTWGSMYETSELSIGNYAQPFIEIPQISVMPRNTFFVEKKIDISSTSWGNFWAVRPVSMTMYIGVDCIAIGKWK